MRECDGPWATSRECIRLPLEVIILSPFALRLYRAAEQETDSHYSRIHVPNTPKIGCLTCCKFSFFFNCRPSRDCKPVYPSPLAFVLQSLGFFLSSVALSFHGGFVRCLCGAGSTTWCLGKMNSAFESWHASTIQFGRTPLPVMVIWPFQPHSGVVRGAWIGDANSVRSLSLIH